MQITLTKPQAVVGVVGVIKFTVGMQPSGYGGPGSLIHGIYMGCSKLAFAQLIVGREAA